MLFAVVGGLLLWQLSQFGVVEVSASDADVIEIENYFPSSQLQLIDSYAVAGNWSGDIERSFSASLAGLSQPDIDLLPGVERGDQLSIENAAAVRFVAENIGDGELPWFPGLMQILTEYFYIAPLSVVADGEFIDSARLILINPANHMLYYAWLKF